MATTPAPAPAPRRPGLPQIMLVVVVLLVVVGIVAFTRTDQDDRTAYVTPVPSVSPSASSKTSPTAKVALVPYANCSLVKFGPALAPLNPPASVHTYKAVPATTIDASKLYLMTIVTKRGTITICMQPDLAPNTVNVLVTLIRNRYYDGIPFHRITTLAADGIAVAQVGDPDCIGHAPPSPAAVTGSCGQGGPGFKFDDEAVKQAYVAGAVAMANSGANTNGSQFFICTANDTSGLASSYNLFGKVQTGLSVAQAIEQGDVMTSVTVQEQT